MAKLLTVLGQVEARRERADAVKNRARILDAARKLMKKRPLDEICMDELAAVAGVGKGTLYRRFADKSALLHALLDDSERALQGEVQKSFASRGARPREHLVWILDSLFAFVVDHARIVAAAEGSARGSARFDCPPYAWRFSLVSEALRRAGVARGEAAAQLADMLLASMSGEIVARSITTQPPDEVRAQARAFFDVIASTTIAPTGQAVT